MSRARTMIEESTGTSPGSMGETSRALLGDKAASWTYLIVYGIFAFLVPPCCPPLCCTPLCCTMLCWTPLRCHTMLCWTILCWTDRN